MSNYKNKNFDLKIERGESKYNYIVNVVDTKVENRFEFRVDTSWDLKRFESSSGETIPEKDILSFGFDLYNKVFAGEVGGYFKSQLDQDKNLRIRLLISDTVPELITVPWEFLYDGEKFLATSTQTPILRLPSGTKEVKKDKITEPIKMLIIMSSPSDQPELDMDVEERKILEALDRLIPNKIQIDFEDDATWDNLQDVLIEEAYNIIHYTGHGVFKDGKGYLALESEDGKTDLRDERDLAGLLGEHQSLRLVFLSGCQTAKSSELKAFSGLSGALLKKGIPSVVAMQYSISDESAIQLARKFYTAIANNKPLDIAISEARKSLLFENGRDKIDFAIPALFSSDVNCLKTKEAVSGLGVPEMVLKKSFIFNNVEQLGRNFFGRRKEIKRIKKGFLDNTKRAVIIHGFGGMGKSVLSTKLAGRMSKKLDGVFAFKCDESKLGIDQVLSGINEFLLILGKDDFNEYFREPKRDIKTKISQLADIFSQLKLLIIFDNFEVLLEEENKKEIANEDLRNGLQQLIKGVTQNTKFVFTCRYDFDLLERGYLEDQIDRINLPEFKFADTLNLINNFNELEILDHDTKRKIFDKIGGHPYTLNLFARNCKIKPLKEVLSDLESINKEVIDRTLLKWIYSNLSKKAQELLLKISVFLKDIPYEALKWIMDNQKIDVEIEDLIHWGVMAYTPESELYSIHSIAKNFARNKIEGETKKVWQIKAADFYLDLAKQTKRTKKTFNYLDARNLYFEAGEFEKAGEIVHKVTPSLRTYGLIEYAKDLNKMTIETTSGKNKAVAINDLGRIYHGQMDFRKAVELYNESLEIFKEIDDKESKKRIAYAFQDLGRICKAQDDYSKADKLYRKSMDVFKEIDDKLGVAYILYKLGSLYHLNDPRNAVDFYTRSLDIYKEIGDKNGIAMILHALGNIDHLKGNYDKALELYNESLDLKREVEDTIGIVYTLHEKGNLCKDQGNHAKAVEYYNESLRVARDLREDKLATAITLRKLGSVYRLCKSSEAIDSYRQSLSIAEKLENEDQIATTYLGLGDVYFAQENYSEAIEWYNKSLKIFEKQGIKRMIAETRRHLGDFYQAQDDYPTAVNYYKRSLDIRKEIGDKRGTAEIYQALGKICQAQKEYKSAMENYLAALQIYEELQSPDKEIVKQRLDEIKDEIGEELFARC